MITHFLFPVMLTPEASNFTFFTFSNRHVGVCFPPFALMQKAEPKSSRQTQMAPRVLRALAQASVITTFIILLFITKQHVFLSAQLSQKLIVRYYSSETNAGAASLRLCMARLLFNGSC